MEIMFVIALILFVLCSLKIFSKLSLGRCVSPTCLVGKTVLITGANSGIGYQTSLILAGRGCRIIMADKDNCEKSKATIMNETGNTNIVTKQFNLASLKSVRRLAEDINNTEDKLDILINNAGAAGLGNSYTEDGLHIGMQVNHFGSFLLTHLLIKLMRKSKCGRIIFVSSIIAFVSSLTVKNLNFPSDAPSGFLTDLLIYANSKLCNILTANEFARKLKGSGIVVNSVYPGIVDTVLFTQGMERKVRAPIWEKLLIYFFYFTVKPFGKTAYEGAQTTVHVALAKQLEHVTGRFFVDCKQFIMPFFATDYLARNIWKASENYTRLAPDEKF